MVRRNLLSLSSVGPGTEPSYDEDCLYLNVTAPRAANRKPVLVWIHGGGLVNRDGAYYDATRLAAQGDVVVVTFNYRLGVFGFLSHPELGRTGGDFGLEDQTAALRWVQRNIRAFGGDPGNVTVAGESGGAFSTCALLASPRTVGLIDKAIVESGTCSVFFPRNSVLPGLGEARLVAPRAETEQIGVATAARVGCSTLTCLREVTVQTWVDSGLVNSAAQLSYHTRFLPVDPLRRPGQPVHQGAGRRRAATAYSGGQHMSGAKQPSTCGWVREWDFRACEWDFRAGPGSRIGDSFVAMLMSSGARAGRGEGRAS